MRLHRYLGALGTLLLASCTFLTDTSGLARESLDDGGPIATGDGGGDGGAESSIDATSATPCIDTRGDPLHCGRCGHSCLGDRCVEGACQITALATGQDGAYGIDVDDTSVYWSNMGSRSLAKIDKNATNGVAITLLQKPSPFLPFDVRVDGAYLGVVDHGSGNGGASVFRVNKSVGGQEIDVGSGCSPDGNSGIAFDATYAYFVNGVLGNVYRATKGSGDCSAIVTNQHAVSHVVVDDASVFFTNEDPPAASSGIMSAPKAGGTASAIAKSSIPKATGVVMDGAALFASTPDGRIVRVNKDGSGFAELATNQPSPIGVAVDESSIYWANGASAEVWAADKAAGNPRLIASNQTGVTMVAVDGDRIYWATKTSILRVAK